MTPKQTIHRIFALATLAATAFLSQALHAQVNVYASSVNVPFAFDYGTQHFTAGTYTVKMLDMNVLSVSNNAETGWAIIQSDTEPGRSSDGYLIFRKYGNRYFLAEYHPANSQTSASVMQSKKERSVARDYASNKADQGRVRLALLQNGEALPSAR